MIRRHAIAAILIAAPAFAQDAPAPKLGPNAIPIEVDNAYLRSSPAPDYWAFSPYTKPQFTTSACSVASVTAAVNGLTGLPKDAASEVMSQPALLELVGDSAWTAASAEEGIGVTFAQLAEVSQKALTARGLTDYRVETFHPTAADDATKAQLRAALAANESSAADVMMIYFNQGVETGDWDGPHVSLIGAYDVAMDRVLILEVDQAWYTSYWTPTDVLLEAMLRPAPEDQGPLAGETGGLVHLLK